MVVLRAILGSGFLLRSTSCIHAVVRAVLPCSRENITIFRSALHYECRDAAILLSVFYFSEKIAFN